MIQEKTPDPVEKTLPEVRAVVAQSLPKIAEVFAGKAKDDKIASVPHARFLLDLLDLEVASAAGISKSKPERQQSEAAEGGESFRGLTVQTLEEMVIEAEERIAAQAGAVK